MRPGEPGDNVGNTTYFCCLSAHKLPATTPSISSGGNILLAFFLSSPITWLVFFTFVDVRTTWVYRPPHSGINNLQYKLISLQYSYSIYIDQMKQRCTYLVKVGLISNPKTNQIYFDSVRIQAKIYKTLCSRTLKLHNRCYHNVHHRNERKKCLRDGENQVNDSWTKR